MPASASAAGGVGFSIAKKPIQIDGAQWERIYADIDFRCEKFGYTMQEGPILVQRRPADDAPWSTLHLNPRSYRGPVNFKNRRHPGFSIWRSSVKLAGAHIDQLRAAGYQLRAKAKMSYSCGDGPIHRGIRTIRV